MDLRYVAGFFDGEGCVNFGFGHNREPYIQVHVVNTNRVVLKDLQRKFGGNINPLVHRRPDWKPSWAWRLSWNRAVDFLEAIYPYLRIKREQALVAFGWSETRPRKFNGVRDKATDDFLVAELHWLNKKGPNHDPRPRDAILAEVANGNV